MSDVITKERPQLPSTELSLQQIDRKLTLLAQHNQQVNVQLAGMMREMAGQMRAMHEQLAEVTRQLADQAQRTPLSPLQRSELTRAIRSRAATLAAHNGWTDARRINAIAAAIRLSIRDHIRRACGLSIRAMADVPACQHAVVLELVAMWEEWAILDEIGKG